MLFDTRSTLTAEASLNSLWLKTQVIANNIANVDTPGFKASNVTFEEALEREVAVQNKEGQEVSRRETRRPDQFRSRITTDTISSVRVDGNNVSMEREQAEMWKTYAQYSYLLDRVGGHYTSIGNVISSMRSL